MTLTVRYTHRRVLRVGWKSGFRTGVVNNLCTLNKRLSTLPGTTRSSKTSDTSCNISDNSEIDVNDGLSSGGGE